GSIPVSRSFPSITWEHPYKSLPQFCRVKLNSLMPSPPLRPARTCLLDMLDIRSQVAERGESRIGPQCDSGVARIDGSDETGCSAFGPRNRSGSLRYGGRPGSSTANAARYARPGPPPRFGLNFNYGRS